MQQSNQDEPLRINKRSKKLSFSSGSRNPLWRKFPSRSLTMRCDEWFECETSWREMYSSNDNWVFLISWCKIRLRTIGKQRNKRSATAVGGGLSPVYRSTRLVRAIRTTLRLHDTPGKSEMIIFLDTTAIDERCTIVTDAPRR